MFSVEQLQFAQRYPFTKTAKRVVEAAKLDLEDIPQDLVQRAKVWLKHAIQQQPLLLPLVQDEEVLEREVLSFPVAKIFVSLLEKPQALDQFARLVAKTSNAYLNKEPEKHAALQQLAQELEIHALPVEFQGTLCYRLPLPEFLHLSFKEKELRLQHVPLEKGQVYLNENLFSEFLSQSIYQAVFLSLPVPLEKVPGFLKKEAEKFRIHWAEEQKKFYIAQGFSGTVENEAFSPCMKSLYTKLISGENLPHMARFSLATFLMAVGMPEEEIVQAFSKAPNYDEKTTRYQLSNLRAKKYSVPACSKMREYGYCPLENCQVSHSLTFYQRNQGKRTGQKKEEPK